MLHEVPALASLRHVVLDRLSRGDLDSLVGALILAHDDSDWRLSTFAPAISLLLDQTNSDTLHRGVDVAMLGCRMAFGRDLGKSSQFSAAAVHELEREPCPPLACIKDDDRLLLGISAGIGAVAHQLISKLEAVLHAPGRGRGLRRLCFDTLALTLARGEVTIAEPTGRTALADFFLLADAADLSNADRIAVLWFATRLIGSAVRLTEGERQRLLRLRAETLRVTRLETDRSRGLDPIMLFDALARTPILSPGIDEAASDRSLTTIATLHASNMNGTVDFSAADTMRARAVDIAILTIREDEFRAVLQVFPKDREILRGRRHYNLRTTDAGAGGTYRLAIVRQIEQGNGEAQDAARDILEELQPRLLLVVGIAGGLPSEDFTLGDVVVSTRVNDYSVEARKEGEVPSYNISGGPIAMTVAASVANLPAMDDELGDWTGSLPERPSVDVESSNISGPTLWQKAVRESLDFHFGHGRSRAPIVTAGIIASSDRLIKDPSVLFPWIETARHLLAVEMESGGVYRAARDRALMVAIRGISDIVGLKRNDRWTKYACASAAAFVEAYLRTTPIPHLSSPPPRDLGVAMAARRAPTNGSLFRAAEAPVRMPLPPVAKLVSRTGSVVPALAWQLEMRSSTHLDHTKTELHEALLASVLTYSMKNYGRTARWPRVLAVPGASSATTRDGHLWAWTYRTEAVNRIGDEQLLLAPDGSFIFQRDTLSDVEDISLDFGVFAPDIVQFLRFIANYAARLKHSGELTASATVWTPQTTPGTLAIFHNTPAEPEQPDRVGRLNKSIVSGSVRLDLASLEDSKYLVSMGKRLVDRIANEFILEPSWQGSTAAAFMAISAESLARVAEYFA